MADWPLMQLSAVTAARSLASKRHHQTYRVKVMLLFFIWHNSPQWARASSFTRFLDHTQRRTTVGRTPLDEWSARRRDLYLTTHDNHNRQISMPPVGFEPTIPASERPQTYALRRRGHWDRQVMLYTVKKNCLFFAKANMIGKNVGCGERWSLSV